MGKKRNQKSGSVPATKCTPGHMHDFTQTQPGKKQSRYILADGTFNDEKAGLKGKDHP